MTDHIDVLRIIARDGGRLDSAVRAELAEIANEFERTQRMLLETQKDLIESQAMRIATNERLLEMKRAEISRRPLSMSTGWVKVSGWLA